MPTIPLGHFVYNGHGGGEEISVAVGLDVEDDFTCVHVRIFSEVFGTALVVVGIDSVGHTYNLLVPSSRVRAHGDRVFNTRPTQPQDRRPHLGALFRALPVPTLVLNASDEEPENEEGLEEGRSEDEFAQPLGAAPAPDADALTPAAALPAAQVAVAQAQRAVRRRLNDGEVFHPTR
jgi:hypothetical protein